MVKKNKYNISDDPNAGVLPGFAFVDKDGRIERRRIDRRNPPADPVEPQAPQKPNNWVAKLKEALSG